MSIQQDVPRVSLYNKLNDAAHPENSYYIGKFIGEKRWFLFKQDNGESKRVSIMFDDLITLNKCAKLISTGDISSTQYFNSTKTMNNKYVNSVEDAIFHRKGTMQTIQVKRPYAIGFRYENWISVDYGDDVDFQKLEDEANCGYKRKGISTEEFWYKF